MDFIILSGRNLWKQRSRTAFVLATIAVCGIVMLLLKGYLNFTYWGLGSGIIHGPSGGHFHIHKSGFAKYGQKEPSKYVLTQEEAKKLTDALKKIKEVQVVSPRLGASGLLTDGTNSTFFAGVGVKPELDGQIRFKTGNSYLQGEGLDADMPYQIAIGRGMSEAFSINTGAELTLYATTFEGRQNAANVKVGGVFDAGQREANALFIELSLDAVQKLLDTTAVGSLASGLKEDPDDFLEWYDDALLAYLKKIEPELRKAVPDIEVTSWMDAFPYYKSVKNLYDTTFSIIRTILIGLIILSITNILLMSVMERTREIGVMRAMGFNKTQVGAVFVLEGLWLGVVGGLSAALLGLLLSKGINYSEFTWTPPGYTQPTPVMVMTQTSDYFSVFFLLASIAVVSSAGALIRAFRLTITECLRVK